MIACALLAAGGSRRLGTPKQLVVFREETLIAQAIAACGGLGRLGIVLGAHREAIAKVIGAAEILANDAWEEGMASSIRVAAAWARGIDTEALLLHLVDQPLIEQEHLARLVEAYRAGAPLVGTRYDDEVIGAPALFDARFYDELLALKGDRGAAGILRSHPETAAIPFTGAAIDVDTPEDVQRLLASSPNAIRR